MWRNGKLARRSGHMARNRLGECVWGDAMLLLGVMILVGVSRTTWWEIAAVAFGVGAPSLLMAIAFELGVRLLRRASQEVAGRSAVLDGFRQLPRPESRQVKLPRLTTKASVSA
jgi:hypothetical protein